MIRTLNLTLLSLLLVGCQTTGNTDYQPNIISDYQPSSSTDSQSMLQQKVSVDTYIVHKNITKTKLDWNVYTTDEKLEIIQHFTIENLTFKLANDLLYFTNSNKVSFALLDFLGENMSEFPKNELLIIEFIESKRSPTYNQIVRKYFPLNDLANTYLIF